MALFMYSAQNGRHASTQTYLASVKICECCLSPQPKEDFKMFEGVEQCLECIAEITAERSYGDTEE
jgi:hypothetical protein